MKNFLKTALSSANQMKESLHPHIQSSCDFIKNSVHTLFQSQEKNSYETPSQHDVSKEYGKNKNIENPKKTLIPYSIEFHNVKYIVLSYENNSGIYKVFPLNGGYFLEGENLDQIQTLFENHKRRFFKKIKSTKKFKKHVKNIFTNIGNSSSTTKNKKQTSIDTQKIEKKLSPAERIKLKKQEKNKLKNLEKQKQQNSHILQKQQEIQRENIFQDYQNLFGFSTNISKILAWNHKKISQLSSEEHTQKKQQIQAASSVYKILLARLDATTFEETKNIAPQKRFKILKSKIKKYLNKDFGNDQETINRQRHLHHLVNSSCDILVDSITHKNQKSQWTDYYSQAA